MSVTCSLNGVGSQLKLSVVALYLYKALFGSYPHDIRGVNIERMNEIAADAAVFIRIISEYFERIAIEPVEAVLGAEPQKSFLILHTADNGII